MIQFHLFNRGKPVADFLAGYRNIFHIFIGLSNVVGELFHAVVKAREFFTELAKFILDDMYLLACLDVLQHRADRIEYRHHRRRRDNPDTANLRILNQISMVCMDFGKYGFGGNEHDRAFRGHVGNDVFRCDGLDVLFYVGLEHCR